MSIKKTPTRVTVEFEPYCTVADLCEAAEDLRARVGPDAIVRSRGRIEFDKDGARVTSLTAEPVAEESAG